MNVLLLRWDTKPDKRIRRTFLRPASTRRTSFYAAIRSARAVWLQLAGGRRVVLEIIGSVVKPAGIRCCGDRLANAAAVLAAACAGDLLVAAMTATEAANDALRRPWADARAGRMPGMLEGGKSMRQPSNPAGPAVPLSHTASSLTGHRRGAAGLWSGVSMARPLRDRHEMFTPCVRWAARLALGS